MMNDQEASVYKQMSSVQIEIDSKGSKKYVVKVYDEDPDVAYEKALQLSNKLDRELRR